MKQGAAWATLVWIGVILFSSTSLASQWAEATFRFISGRFISPSSLGSSYDLVHLLADKGFHVGLFLILALLLWATIRRSPGKPLVILLCGAIVGTSSELLQRAFPDRDPAIRDVFINAGGTALGILLCLFWTRESARRERVTVTAP